MHRTSNNNVLKFNKNQIKFNEYSILGSLSPFPPFREVVE